MARINFKKRGPFVDVADPSNPPSGAKDLPAEWFNNIETAIKGLDDFTDDAATTVKATDTQGITETTNKGKKIFLQVLLDKIVNMVNTLNRKMPSGYQIKTATYTVPQQDTETNLFAIPTSIVPSDAFAFYAVVANLGHGIIITGCYLGPDKQWRIVTDIKSYGNFFVQMLYLVAE